MYNTNKEQAKKVFSALASNSKYSADELFTDMVAIASLAYQNVRIFRFSQEVENEYKEITSKYTKEEMSKFAQILSFMIGALEAQYGDFLGELYMEMGLGNKYKGQFFTPYSVCKCMADISCTPDLLKEIETKGFITINDPACGGSALPIAMLDVLHNKHNVNFQKNVLCIVQDLDKRCVDMSYVALSMIGACAIVRHADTLMNKVFSSYETFMYRINKWKFSGASKVLIDQLDNNKLPEKDVAKLEKQYKKAEQMQLF